MSSLISLFSSSKPPKPAANPPAKPAASEASLKARNAKRRAGSTGYESTFYAGKEQLG